MVWIPISKLQSEPSALIITSLNASNDLNPRYYGISLIYFPISNISLPIPTLMEIEEQYCKVASVIYSNAVQKPARDPADLKLPMCRTTLILCILAVAIFFGSSAAVEEKKAIAKRQTYYYYYYICGSWPYQWTSYYPCNYYNPQPQPQPSYCNNGGSPTGYSCYSDYQCNNYYSGTSCINGQCCTRGGVNPTTQMPSTLQPAPLCGGRETNNGYCNGGMCGGAFVCTSQNVCCRCSSGVSAGPCVNNKCPQGLTCNSVGQCCTITVG
ncbi:hypothetical protein QR680_003922 [Steinernema hermaphroditum]|uniref:CC domain-containing protein n=1 Tax=Steinernema hermaphroditum TaxID=289476 RepID=A0AA39HM28_9BILA|nr:hypothetical protein QR680_003922 [Steinernema hermaphroditum]